MASLRDDEELPGHGGAPLPIGRSYRCTFGPGLMGGHEARKKSTARHEIISGRAGPARCIGPCLGRRRGPWAGTSPARLSRPEMARLLARKGLKCVLGSCSLQASRGLKLGHAAHFQIPAYRPKVMLPVGVGVAKCQLPNAKKLKPYVPTPVTGRQPPSFPSRVTSQLPSPSRLPSPRRPARLQRDRRVRQCASGRARPATADRSRDLPCASATTAASAPCVPAAYASATKAAPAPTSSSTPANVYFRAKCVFQAIFVFRAARLKHGTFSEIRAGPWAEGSARGPARHDPNLILGRAGPKLNVPGLFGLGPDRAGRPECTPIGAVQVPPNPDHRAQNLRLDQNEQTDTLEPHLIRSLDDLRTPFPLAKVLCSTNLVRPSPDQRSESRLLPSSVHRDSELEHRRNPDEAHG
jgi:hypothetical protein